MKDMEDPDAPKPNPLSKKAAKQRHLKYLSQTRGIHSHPGMAPNTDSAVSFQTTPLTSAKKNPEMLLK